MIANLLLGNVIYCGPHGVLLINSVQPLIEMEVRWKCILDPSAHKLKKTIKEVRSGFVIGPTFCTEIQQSEI